MRIKKIIYMIVGFVGVGLGSLGVVLPFLPSVPFYLMAAFCFAKSSKKIHDKFCATNLYKKNLESYVKGQGMTRMTKIRIMVSVTVLMLIGFIMMREVPIGSMVLLGIWIFHILYFSFGVKTQKNKE